MELAAEAAEMPRAGADWMRLFNQPGCLFGNVDTSADPLIMAN
jgi:hypothetical protein